MEPINASPLSRTNRIFRIAGWTGILLIGSFFLLFVALPYLTLNETLYDRFWVIKWWVFGHVAGGSVALMVGPFQFWSSFRNKYLQIHRKLGMVYLVSIGIAVICSFKMAATTALDISWQWALSLTILGVIWILTTGMAYRYILKKNIIQHKEWMIRSYVVTFAFVAFRILLGLGIGTGLGEFEEVAPTAAWASWSIPLVITEMAIQWNKS